MKQKMKNKDNKTMKVNDTKTTEHNFSVDEVDVQLSKEFSNKWCRTNRNQKGWENCMSLSEQLELQSFFLGSK